MSAPTALEYRTKALALGYKVFEESKKAPYNLNIVGWRLKEYKVNGFFDYLSVYWMEEGLWFEESWLITTYPGKPWLLAPLFEKGTAILVPGQYEGAYALGRYKTYVALKQVKPVKVYRDKNLDSQIDLNPATIEEGLFGIHIHKAGMFSKYVGLNSAGCQVFQKAKDFNEFISLCDMAEFFWGNKFTYTLMEL